MENKDIKPLIDKYEAKMGVEIIAVFAKNASHYLTVPLIYAILLSLPTPFLLYHVTNLTFNLIMSLQLLVFIFSFLLIHLTPLKLALTPSYHINDRLKQRVRDLAWNYNAFSKNQYGAIIVFNASQENKSMMGCDKHLDIKISEQDKHHLTEILNKDGVEAMLEKLSETLKNSHQKTDMTNNEPLRPTALTMQK